MSWQSLVVAAAKFLEKLLMVDRIPVLVTAIGGGGHGEQILKALRLAEGERYIIHGADTNANCPQFKLVHRHFQAPPATHPEFVDTILSYCQAHGIRALFHGCEPELKAYSDARDRFAEAQILLPINPAGVIKMCMDKERTASFLDKLGFEPPQHALVVSIEAAEAINWFPVVIKPHVGGGGSANCFIAQDRNELIHLLTYLKVDNQRSVMVQEYVGTPDNEFTVGVLHDLEGRFINSIALRRELKSGLSIRTKVSNTSGRRELGSALVISSGVSQGEVGRFPEVTEPCKKIATAMGAMGPINIQCRLVNGSVKVFEINPRFSGTTSIRALMGFNEPDLLLRRHLLQASIETNFSYREGKVLRSLTETVV